jgi:hypothetical protein
MEIETRHGDIDPGFTGFGELFVVADQATAGKEPGEGAFDDPATLPSFRM